MAEPPGRAVVSATGRVRALLTRLGVGLVGFVGLGARVGNKLAALPAVGLSVGPAGGIPGRLPTGRGEVTMTGAGAAGVAVAGRAAAVLAGFGAAVFFAVFVVCGFVEPGVRVGDLVGVGVGVLVGVAVWVGVEA